MLLSSSRYGSKLGAASQCDFLQVMKALTALLFGAMNLGQVAALMPDAADAKLAAAKIFRLIDRPSSIDPLSEEGESVVRNKIFPTSWSPKFQRCRVELNKLRASCVVSCPVDYLAGATFCLVLFVPFLLAIRERSCRLPQSRLPVSCAARSDSPTESDGGG